ncbi:MAG: AIR synthase-related protein, partial [Candidatus Neomarinimicrobiota bacterium]
SDNVRPDLEVCVFGEKMVNTINIDESFQNENNFITMLGSHRGELNGSLYQKEIQKISSESIPSVDLGMEARLQEVVLQGIQTRLIQSVSNVSTGGLAAAIAKSLSHSENGIGARIHLSRKLRQDEMLFGETQGLVIVSIKESDLMEFERICMTIGIPSTTIGRVTGDGRFTFNDVVNVAREDL